MANVGAKSLCWHLILISNSKFYFLFTIKISILIILFEYNDIFLTLFFT